MKPIGRRKLITSGLAPRRRVRIGGRRSNGSALWAYSSRLGRYLRAGETLTYAAQRLLTRHSLAREFPRSMISKTPFANEVAPLDAAFHRSQASGFADWRLHVDGKVARPLSLSLSDLRSMSLRNHITEVSCEEGWSYVAEWIGTPLRDVLKKLERYQRLAMWRTPPSKASGGRASIWPMRCIRRLSSPGA